MIAPPPRGPRNFLDINRRECAKNEILPSAPARYGLTPYTFPEGHMLPMSTNVQKCYFLGPLGRPISISLQGRSGWRGVEVRLVPPSQKVKCITATNPCQNRFSVSRTPVKININQFFRRKFYRIMSPDCINLDDF